MVPTFLRRTAPVARRRQHRMPLRLERLEERMVLSGGIQPTAQDQLFLEQLNDARANPAAYGQSIGLDLSSVAASQPLAFNTQLIQESTGHSQDMNDHNYFSHTGSDGSNPGQRITAAGFNWDNYGESIAAGYSTTDQALQALIVDSGISDLGHRRQLLSIDSSYQTQNQVGIGFVTGSGSYTYYYTIDTAHASGDTNSYLTGVVYNDQQHSGHYAVGEGLGGVTVTASNGATTTTWASGGYTLALAPGSYTVTFSGGGLGSTFTEHVDIGSTNVRLNITKPQGPTLDPIPNQSISKANSSLQVALNASSSAGSLSYSASIAGDSAAYDVEQQLGLSYTGSYYQNTLGLQEKWLHSSSSNQTYGGWYVVLQDGSVKAWLGGATLGNTVAILGSADYANPSLIYNAQQPTPPSVGASFSGSTLTLTPPGGFLGTFFVTVTVSDSNGSAQQTFKVLDYDNAPIISPVPNQSAAHNQAPIQVTINGSQQDSEALHYSASASAYSPAYDVEQQLGLQYTGTYYQNSIGLGEKWLRSGTGNSANQGWYVVLPDGTVRPWLGGSSVGTTVATVGTAAYADPSLIYNAQAPASVPVSVSVSGNVVTLTPQSNYLGLFEVNVVASDGYTSTNTSFLTAVTDTAPALAAISDQTVSHTAGSLNVALSAPDAEGDSVSYQVQITGLSPAYDLQQQHAFRGSTNYYTNYLGTGEKWLQATAGNSVNAGWYLIYADGSVKAWLGGRTVSTVLANVGTAAYADPSLIYNAQAPSAPSGVSASVSGNTLTLNGLSSFVGTFAVKVTASDGLLSSSQSFHVTSTNSAPTLAAITNVSATHGNTVWVPFSAADADGDHLSYQTSITGSSPGYDLQQQLHLQYTGTFYANYLGMNEKWLRSSVSNTSNGGWYVVLPDGSVRAWLGGSTLGATVANVGAAAYADPSQIYNAPTPSAPTVQAQVFGNTLALTAPTSYVGAFRVTFTVSDGFTSTSQSFVVNLN